MKNLFLILTLVSVLFAADTPCAKGLKRNAYGGCSYGGECGLDPALRARRTPKTKACRKGEVFPGHERGCPLFGDSDMQYVCTDGKWDQVVMSTSGCSLTASAEKRMHDGDKKIAEWWSRCK